MIVMNGVKLMKAEVNYGAFFQILLEKYSIIKNTIFSYRHFMLYQKVEVRHFSFSPIVFSMIQFELRRHFQKDGRGGIPQMAPRATADAARAVQPRGRVRLR